MSAPQDPFGRVDPLHAEEVLERVLQTAPEARDAEIDRLCGHDPALRTEVRSLLRHLPDPENPDDPEGHASDLQLEGRVIGGCRIQRLLGRGGTGRVFAAMQEWPPRPVAVKVLRPELLTEGARRRFRRETRALARLDHPGIARIHSAGLHLERGVELPFVVMELVDGAQPLTAWWAASRASLEARVALFADICDAVHHGHVRGLVHRDLKPSNVLVGSDGRAKVIDFGVASMTGDEGQAMTLTRAVAGTPGYMAPEQFESGQAVDLRTDVHGLGLLLFECLAGRPAFARENMTLAAAARRITAEDAPSLRALDPCVPADLATVVSHALSKAPSDRYASASEMAADLRRFLSGHPILARPASPARRVRLFAQRNPLAAAAMGIALVAVVAGSAASVAFGIREANQAATAEKALAETQRALWLSRLSEYSRAVESGDAAGSRLAAESFGADASWPVRLLHRQSDESLACFFDHLANDNFSAMGGAVSPDGRVVAVTADCAAGVTLLDASDLHRLRQLSPPFPAWAVTFDPKRGRLLAASDTTLHVWDAPWEGESRKIQLPFEYGTGIAASPDGTRVALANEGNTCVVDIDSGKVLARTPDHVGSTSRVAWSPDGNLIAVGVEPRTVRLLRASDLSEVTRIPAPPLRTLALDFDPTGRWLAFGGDARRLCVVEVANPANRRELMLDHSIWGLRWHPDGTRLAVADRGSGVRQVQASSDGSPLKLLGSYRGHRQEVWWVEWNPAGDRLYSFGQVEIHAWRDRPRAGPERNDLGSPGRALVRDSKGRVLALTGDASVWQLDGTMPPRRIWSGGPFEGVLAAADPDHDRFAWIDAQGNLIVADTATGQVIRSRIERFFDIPNRLAFSPSGRLLAVSGKDASDPLILLDPRTGMQVERIAVPWRLQPSGLMWIDDRTIAAGGFGGALHYRQGDDGRWTILREVGSNWINPRLIGPDRALTASMSGELVERVVTTGAAIRAFHGLADMASSSDVSPDGALVAAVGTDRRLHVFDMSSGDQLISLLGHPFGRMVSGVAFAGDGQSVFTLDSGGSVVTWSAVPGQTTVDRGQ